MCVEAHVQMSKHMRVDMHEATGRRCASLHKALCDNVTELLLKATLPHACIVHWFAKQLGFQPRVLNTDKVGVCARERACVSVCVSPSSAAHVPCGPRPSALYV